MSFFGSIIEGIFGNEAADAQSDAIVEGNRLAADTQMQMFRESNRLNEPWRLAGVGALNEMNALMGLQPVANAFGEAYSPPSAVERAPQGVLDAWHNNQGDVQRHFGSLDSYLSAHRSNYPTHWQNQGQNPPPASGPSGRDIILGADNTVQPAPSNNGQDAAYDRFLNGGFARSMLETTNADWDRMTDQFGAGGNVLSGSYLEALNDQNRRNTNNAFVQHWQGLGGMSGTGGNVAMAQGQQGIQVGQNIGNLQQDSAYARGSSYATQSQNTGNVINSGVNGVANAFGNWF